MMKIRIANISRPIACPSCRRRFYITGRPLQCVTIACPLCRKTFFIVL